MLPDSRSASFLGLSKLSLFDVRREYCRDDLSEFFVDLRLASCNSFIVSEGYKTPFSPHFSDRTFPILNRSHGRANNSVLTPPH